MSPDPQLERARRIAHWLDRRFLDPLLGLFLPGVGDLVGSGAGFYLITVAIQRRLPHVIIARMLLNLALDSLIGALPFVGDLFDLAWRANVRNLALLEARYETRRARPVDWLIVIGAALLLLAALAVPVVLAIWTISRLLAALS